MARRGSRDGTRFLLCDERCRWCCLVADVPSTRFHRAHRAKRNVSNERWTSPSARAWSNRKGGQGHQAFGTAPMKVCMKSAGEVEKLQERLSEAAKEYLSEKEATLPPERVQVLKRVLSQMTAVVGEKLKANICVEGESWEEDEDVLKTPTGKEGAQIAQVSDGELESLKKEVDELAQRITKHRTDVPALLQKQLEENLNCLRPPSPKSKEREEQEEVQVPSPAPADLQQKFQNYSSSLPKMRARVEEALTRMQRIVRAMEDERGRRSPCDIEKAILSPITNDKESYESPKVREAVSTGKINTRRRIARATLMSPYMR